MIAGIKSYITEEKLLDGCHCIVAAVSGGIDSMVMADILYQLRSDLNFELVIANFNHRLRAEAEEEAVFVGEWARAHHLAYHTASADIRKLSEGSNLQNTARQQRYAFLRGLAYQYGGALIATAHHCDDQAETVLLHLLRGSGLSGLAAIQPRENGIIRPLLNHSRADIAAYASANAIEYREDSTNASPKYVRNKIRLQLLPQLRTYNPQIVEALNITARICRDEDSLLEDMASIRMAELWDVDNNMLDAQAFDALAPALQRRLLRKAFCLLAGDHAELSFSHVQAILALRDEQSCDLPCGLKAYRRGNLYFATQVPPLVQHEEVLPLIIDGCWHKLADWGWQYCACRRDKCGWNPDQIRLSEEQAIHAVWRTRRQGDSVPSSGKKGRRKLKDLFIRAGIPVYQRNTWPLLVLSDRLLWIPRLWTDSCDSMAQSSQKEEAKSILIRIKQCVKI